jgi:hypothetical protein
MFVNHSNKCNRNLQQDSNHASKHLCHPHGPTTTTMAEMGMTMMVTMMMTMTLTGDRCPQILWFRHRHQDNNHHNHHGSCHRHSRSLKYTDSRSCTSNLSKTISNKRITSSVSVANQLSVGQSGIQTSCSFAVTSVAFFGWRTLFLALTANMGSRQYSEK